MKLKIISILSIFLIIAQLFVGCSAPSDGSSAEDNGTLPDLGETYTDGILHIRYSTFEECLESATHIISATYTGESIKSDMNEHLKFTPNTQSQLKGSKISEDFYISTAYRKVVVVDNYIEYREMPETFTAGETYLLVLQRSVSVYKPYDVYLPLGNIIISEKNITQGTMYNNSPIYNHSEKGAEINGLILPLYIQSYLKDLPPQKDYIGYDYIRSEDINDIVKGSEFIARVTPKELMGGVDNYIDRYRCTVESVHKGELSETEVELLFFADSVTVGSQYVVMFDKRGESTYSLSSKNSVYSVYDTEAILQIQNALANS